MRIKAFIKREGHRVKMLFRTRATRKSYRNGIKLSKNRNRNGKIKVFFILAFPEAWNSFKTIYESALRSDKTEPLVIALPKFLNKNSEDTSPENLKFEAWEFLSKNGVKCINGFENGKWFDIEAAEPDYVFYTRPYNPEYNEAFKTTTVCRYAKVCYVPYAYSMLGGKNVNTVLPEEFVASAYKLFLANDSRRLQSIDYFCGSKKSKEKKFRYLGFPRLDLLKEAGAAKDPNHKFTVSWMPRWRAGEELGNQKGSHFLQYYKDFIEYFSKNTDMNMIIRPHPLMMDYFVKNGVMSQGEIDRFKEVCSNSSNISLDTEKDYMITLGKTDILVADYTSLIAECFFMGKPIVYCDTADNLNPEGTKICSNLYNAGTFDDVTTLIEKIRDEGDVMKDQREKLIRELIPGSIGNIGISILDEIERDHTESHSN